MSKVRLVKTDSGSVVEKLEDDFLENIMGGFLSRQAFIYLCTCATFIVVGSAGALGCGVAGSVCSSKSAKAMDEGDLDKAHKYAKTAKDLGVAAAVCGAGALGGAGGIAAPIAVDW